MEDVHRTDVIIIGAGPVGLFSVFELGLYDMKAALIDTLEVPGGQCAELYPEKPIYDIPAFPTITGQELTDNLMEQIKPFAPRFFLGQSAEKCEKIENGWRITTSENKVIEGKVVVIAAGGGIFSPKKPALDNLEAYEGSSVFYSVKKTEDFHGKDLVIAGGGDSALDWALYFVPHAKSVTLVHHRDGFRAAPDSVSKIKALAAEGKLNLEIAKLKSLHGSGCFLNSIEVVRKSDGEIAYLKADAFLAFYGLTMKAGSIGRFGVEMENNLVKVDTERFQTNIESIFAIGDINTYPGKQKLILSGFHEAALMAKGAFEVVYPEKKFRFQYTTSSTNLQTKLGV